jgi:hyperosmotically inducible periplasmic protein
MYKNKLSRMLLLVFFSLASHSALADESMNDAFDNIAKNVNVIAQKTGNMIQDAAISAAIATKFLLDKNLAQYNINATTENGVVTLSGKVNSVSEVNNAIAIASSTNGVKSVNASQLLVTKSNQPVADMAITTKIKTLFLKEKLFGDLDLSANNVTVETNNGVVYLGGTTESSEQADTAVKLAQSVSGVEKVVPNIIVVKKDN